MKVPNKNISGVGALIYSVSTHRYLFLLRDNCKHSGTWGLAGGKVEANEVLLDSLYRELKEELGYDFETSKVIPLEKFTSENSKFTYHTFLIPVREEFIPLLNDEHRGYCWVYLTDHPNPLHPGVWRTFNFKAVIDKITTLESVL
jgi:8-oxo-dGTP pyrophosphatase MutT (NUDIX family)